MSWFRPKPQAPAPADESRAPRVVVTGLGPVSAVGCGRNDFYQALLEGRTGFGPITLCDARGLPSQVAAEVKDFRLERFVEHGRALSRWLPRPAQLALAAAVLALHDAEIDIDAVDRDRLGLIVGTGVGNLKVIDDLASGHRDGAAMPAHAAFTSIHHSAACVLSSFLDVRGTSTTVSTGCNSGIDGLGHALRSLQAGAADAVLVVGTDCEVVAPVIAALCASGSLATRYNEDPTRASRPFDAERDGNVVGEGACALLLETEAHAEARGARRYARVAGYHMAAAGGGRRYSADAPDLDPGPATRALRGALREAGWQPDQLDLVNANGSASKLYDPLEARAILEVLAGADVPVHSIKSMLGQHGAGSSALQCAAACLTLRRGVAPPTANHERLDPACAGLRVLTEPLAGPYERVLVHSIGLGGFYYSAAAFEDGGWGDDENLTGNLQVRWSEAHHPRHLPAPEFQEPLKPWRGRGALEAPPES